MSQQDWRELASSVLTRLQAGDSPARDISWRDVSWRNELRDAVKASLGALVERAPGRSVEVRVPPFAAVQVVEGSTHRRGTPPAVVETDPATWLSLALGETTWQEAVASGRLRASGERSDLSAYLPLI